MTTTAYDPLLDHLIDVLPIIQNVIPTDIAIMVGNTEHVLRYFPGKKINLQIKPGTPFSPETPAYRAITTNTPSITQLPASMFGFECTASIYPIQGNDRSVIGIISVHMQRGNEEELRTISNTLVESITGVSTNLETVMQGANQVSGVGNELLIKSKQANECVTDISKLIDMIRKISDKTNILGLNASIEAARANEYGRGFSVVANEIRTLSLDTKSSVQSIQSALQQMQSLFQGIHDSIQVISNVAALQNDSTKEVHDHVDHILSLSKRLKEFADLI